MNHAEAVAHLKKSSLAKHAKALAPFLVPGYLIRTKRSPIAKIKVGASRFGGLPDVPAKFEWPTWEMKSEIVEKKNPFKPGEVIKIGSKGGMRTMHFLAQIRLEELPDAPGRELLPTNGMLYFFYDSRETLSDPSIGIGWKVIHDTTPVKDLVRLKKSPVPKDEADFQPCELTFVSGVSGRNQDLPIKGWDYELEQKWTGVLDEVEGATMPRHRLLGSTRTIQYDVRYACTWGDNKLTLDDDVSEKKRATLKKEEADWVLLLQLDHDEATAWHWMGGRVYFMIRKQDLAAGRFDRVWVEMQYD